MAKQTYSGISVKAAAVTGAVIGFLFWLFGGAGMGFGWMSVYGYMDSMVGYYAGGYAGFAALYFAMLAVLAVVGAVIGAVIAWVYNWALTLG